MARPPRSARARRPRRKGDVAAIGHQSRHIQPVAPHVEIAAIARLDRAVDRPPAQPLDRSAPRLARLRENLARMQLTAEIVTADALTWQPDAPFDAALLDAPCTATGTWRRHPEVLATLTPADITELASLQRALLARAWRWLKPGGRLVYCTCSLEPEEGEDQAHWFAETHADATPLTPTSAIPADYFIAPHVLRTRPDYAAAHHGMDGFFAMGWQKRSR